MKLSLHPRRFFPSSSLAQRWLEQGVSRVLRQALAVPAETRSDFPPPLDEDDDVLAPLRKVVCP